MACLVYCNQFGIPCASGYSSCLLRWPFAGVCDYISANLLGSGWQQEEFKRKEESRKVDTSQNCRWPLLAKTYSHFGLISAHVIISVQQSLHCNCEMTTKWARWGWMNMLLLSYFYHETLIAFANYSCQLILAMKHCNVWCWLVCCDGHIPEISSSSMKSYSASKGWPSIRCQQNFSRAFWMLCTMNNTPHLGQRVSP